MTKHQKPEEYLLPMIAGWIIGYGLAPLAYFGISSAVSAVREAVYTAQAPEREAKRQKALETCKLPDRDSWAPICFIGPPGRSGDTAPAEWRLNQDSQQIERFPRLVVY